MRWVWSGYIVLHNKKTNQISTFQWSWTRINFQFVLEASSSVGEAQVFHCLLGCLSAGVFIVATGYTQQPRTSVIFLVLGVGFSGLNAIGYAVNHLDIAPPFAGILMGLTNTFASTPGFISPQITGFVTSNKVSHSWLTFNFFALRGINKTTLNGNPCKRAGFHKWSIQRKTRFHLINRHQTQFGC